MPISGPAPCLRSRGRVSDPGAQSLDHGPCVWSRGPVSGPARAQTTATQEEEEFPRNSQDTPRIPFRSLRVSPGIPQDTPRLPFPRIPYPRGCGEPPGDPPRCCFISLNQNLEKQLGADSFLLWVKMLPRDSTGFQVDLVIASLLSPAPPRLSFWLIQFGKKQEKTLNPPP